MILMVGREELITCLSAEKLGQNRHYLTKTAVRRVCELFYGPLVNTSL